MTRWHLALSSLIPLLLVTKASALNTSCQNLIIVNPEAEDMNKTTVFLNLQEALQLIMTESNSEAPDCFNVTIAPGNYTLFNYFTIKTNFVLHGSNSETASVFITFNVADHPAGHTSPPYAIHFQSAEFVKMTGINFQHSPGIIGFDDITKVVIEDSSFRFDY